MLFKKCAAVGLSCVYEENETKENRPMGHKPSIRNLSRDRKKYFVLCDLMWIPHALQITRASCSH